MNPLRAFEVVYINKVCMCVDTKGFCREVRPIALSTARGSRTPDCSRVFVACEEQSWRWLGSWSWEKGHRGQASSGCLSVQSLTLLAYQLSSPVLCSVEPLCMGTLPSLCQACVGNLL